MDERIHTVRMTRRDAIEHARRLMDRAHASPSKATREFLLDAVARIDTAMVSSQSDEVAVEGRLGWIRIIGLQAPEMATEGA